MHEDTYQFWVVWNQRGGAPTVVHTDAASAQFEAERLASANPGQRFYVLKGLRYAQIQRCAVTELQPPPPSCPF